MSGQPYVFKHCAASTSSFQQVFGETMKKTTLLRSQVTAVLALTLLLALLVQGLMAQSSGTSGLGGVVTDPSGAAVPNVTVTLTSNSTGQSRTATTGSDGSYKFSLLPPGDYKVRFSASGFKVSEVASTVLQVTETPTLDRVLEVGSQSEQVTVEAAAEVLQTQSSTLGQVVNSQAVTTMPLSSRNYTQILGLEAGASSNGANATALGKGTVDMAVNGNGTDQNNFQMDGISVVNAFGAGVARECGICVGIPIPNPDAIQEFKVQTSTYDASYGRNPGANVNVVTKSGTNAFHGTLFEFTRDSILNAGDFFYDQSAGPDSPRQVLNQQQFGGTVGGPIKKDKIFFFFSYQGTRSKNGVTSDGDTFGAQLPPIPNEPRNTAGFISDLGAENCPTGNDPQHVTLTGAEPMCNGSNISPVAIAYLNLPGPTKSGYYIPTPPITPGCVPNNPLATDPNTYYTCNFSVPSIYNEDQYVGNGDYIFNSKNTLSIRTFYSRNPDIVAMGSPWGGNLPGAPENNYYSNINALMNLTTLVSNNFVNEARVSFQRLVSFGSVSLPAGDTYANLGMTSSTP